MRRSSEGDHGPSRGPPEGSRDREGSPYRSTGRGRSVHRPSAREQLDVEAPLHPYEIHSYHQRQPVPEGYGLGVEIQGSAPSVPEGSGSQPGSMMAIEDPDPAARDSGPWNPGNLPELFGQLEADFPPCPPDLVPGSYAYTGYHLHGHSIGGESSIGRLTLCTTPEHDERTGRHGPVTSCMATDDFNNTTNVPIYVVYFAPHGFVNNAAGDCDEVYALMHQLGSFNDSSIQRKRLQDYIDFNQLATPGILVDHPHQGLQVPYVFCPGLNRRVPHIIFSPNDQEQLDAGYVCDEYLVRFPETLPVFSPARHGHLGDCPQDFEIEDIVGERNVLMDSKRFRERGDVRLVDILNDICKDFNENHADTRLDKGIVLFVASCRGHSGGLQTP